MQASILSMKNISHLIKTFNQGKILHVYILPCFYAWYVYLFYIAKTSCIKTWFKSLLAKFEDDKVTKLLRLQKKYIPSDNPTPREWKG